MKDLSKLKLEFIPVNQVPTTRATQSPWEDIFKQIPAGQALILHEPDVNSGTVRAALVRKQRHNKFKNLQLVTKGKHGTATIYIKNNDKAVPIKLIAARSE
jgi:hypothetical protein